MANEVAGWLAIVTTPGNEPSTRPFKTYWAAWFADEADALKAVYKAIGEYEGLQIVTDRTLREIDLRALGLKKSGDVRDVVLLA